MPVHIIINKITCFILEHFPQIFIQAVLVKISSVTAILI